MNKTNSVKALGFSRGDSCYQLNLKVTQDNYPLVKQLAIKYDVPIIKNPALIKALECLPTNYDLPKELIPVLDLVLNRIDMAN